MQETMHVVPLNDLKPHIESGQYCHCKPSIREHGTVVVHNSYDGREFYEVETPVSFRSDN